MANMQFNFYQKKKILGKNLKSMQRYVNVPLIMIMMNIRN